MTAPLPRINGDSRRHQAAQILREAIVTGQLKPGDRLRELELSEQLQVSRAPLREALRQLEQEGLLISYPYRGTQVLGVSQEEIEEILIPIRMTLERFAVKHALPTMGADELDELGAIVEDMRRAAAAGDTRSLSDADIQFHDRIIEQADQAHCRQIWDMIQPRVWAYFRRDADSHASLDEVVEQHEKYLAALRTGIVETALIAVDQHLTDVPGS
ncbi:GntR family transcriptional regulator [Nocardioides sp.]|uniref:GntR family transcriptional regulator n=1 Tax=Nocardioides sp. TaxID=35761 RepID=UPI002ED87932